ncbi:hypothetical protein [Methanoregula sp.]|uniref:hypothetical protein n=1 Tax=Methanoregula sp. TaxID=2052170 RepID=UPI003C4E5DF0
MSVQSDPNEVPQNDPNARAGFTFDPYAAPCQQGNIISFIPFSYRDDHIYQDGFDVGFRAMSPADIQKCPPFWMDKQYVWEAGQDAGFKAGRLSDADKARIAAQLPVLLTVDPRTGYSIDPWSGPEYLVDVHDPRIPYHTKRQQMVALLAAQEGAAAKDRESIPVCPPMFSDVEHYWDSDSIAGYEATHSNTFLRIKGFVINEFLTKAGTADWMSIALKIAFGPALLYGGSSLLHILGITL